jgi:signal transduction histidine kinase
VNLRLHASPVKQGFVSGASAWVVGGRMEAYELVQEQLRLSLIEIIQDQRGSILDEYYDAFCRRVLLYDRKKRGLDALKEVCLPVKARFSTILDRFIAVLNNKEFEYGYNLQESEQEAEYVLRFVVAPGQHHRLEEHDIIKNTEEFVDIVAKALFNSADPLVKEHGKEVETMLSKLIYITFEDLWVASVVGFRSQQGVIRKLLSKLMKVQEEERQNFWRDVHDDFLQVLAITMVKLETIEELAQKNVEVMKGEVERLRKLINGSTQRLRSLCQGFNLSWFERRGLTFSLRAFIKVFEEQFGIPVKLLTRTGGEQITGFQGVTLLRIVQEALYNMGKHSKARSGKVTLRVAEGQFHLLIEDDGIGFDVKETFKENIQFGHLGLVFMKERLRLLNGSFEVTSVKGKGTRIAARVPLDHNPMDMETSRGGMP